MGVNLGYKLPPYQTSSKPLSLFCVIKKHPQMQTFIICISRMRNTYSYLFCGCCKKPYFRYFKGSVPRNNKSCAQRHPSKRTKEICMTQFDTFSISRPSGFTQWPLKSSGQKTNRNKPQKATNNALGKTPKTISGTMRWHQKKLSKRI